MSIRKQGSAFLYSDDGKKIVGFRNPDETDTITNGTVVYSRLIDRPLASQFGVGACQVGKTLYLSDGANWSTMTEDSIWNRRLNKLPIKFDDFATGTPTLNETATRPTSGISFFTPDKNFAGMSSSAAIKLTHGATGNSYCQMAYATPANFILSGTTLLLDVYKAPGTADALVKMLMFDSAVAQNCTAIFRVKGIGRQIIALESSQFNAYNTVWPPTYDLVSPITDANIYNDIPIRMSGNYITSLVANGTIATITTKDPHGLSTGHIVNIVDTYPSALSESNKTITVTGATTFTYSTTQTATDSSTGGVSRLRLSEVSQVPLGASEEVYIGGVYIAPKAKGVAQIHFDDANIEIYTHAKPILDYFGLKATFNLHTGLAGEPGYVTLAQCKELYDAGWDICIHSHLGLPDGSKGVANYWYNNAPLSNTDVPIASLTGNGTTATVTTTIRHGIPVGVSGFKVNMVNCTPSGFNASAVAVTAIDANTFTYANATSGTASAAQYNENGFTGQYGIIRRPIDEMYWHIGECQRILLANGFDRSAYYMAFPQGAYDNRMITVLNAYKIRIARDTAPYPIPYFGLATTTESPTVAKTNPIDTTAFIPRNEVISMGCFGAESVPVSTNDANIHALASKGGVGCFLLHGGFTFAESMTAGTPGNLLWKLCETLTRYRDAGMLDIMTVSEYEQSLL